jgi:hypothetical protein
METRGVVEARGARHERNRLALLTTEREESAMAAAAIMGDSRIPKNG